MSSPTGVPRESPVGESKFWRDAAATGAALIALLLIGQPAVYARLGSTTAEVVESLRTSRLNDRDARRLTLGYYEQLLSLDLRNQELFRMYHQRPADWRRLDETEIWRSREDFLAGELLPASRIRFKGAELTTNEWGLRDRDTTRIPRPGSIRLAVLGSSHSMGSGVGDDETFETLYEAALAGDFESLNFAVAGYSVPQRLVQLQQQVLGFQPDAVLEVAHSHDVDKLVRFMATTVASGVPMPYPELAAFVADAGLAPGVARSVAERRLRPRRWQMVEWSYRRLAEICEAEKIVPIFVLLPLLEGDSASDSARLLEVARASGFYVVDLSTVYDGVSPAMLRLAEWDYHPNADAHRRIADRLLEELGSQKLVRLLDRPTEPAKP